MTRRDGDPSLAEQDRLIDELLRRLRPAALDQVETERVLSVHEKIICPATVRDTEHFDDLVFTYFNAYWRGLYSDQAHDGLARRGARNFFGLHLHGYPVPPQPKPLFPFPGRLYIGLDPYAYSPQMMAAERNAISGKEHGMLGVVAVYQRHLLEMVVEWRVSSELRHLIPWTETGDRSWLVQRIFDRFGPIIHAEPASPITAAAWWGQEEEFLHQFIVQLRTLRREARL